MDKDFFKEKIQLIKDKFSSLSKKQKIIGGSILGVLVLFFLFSGGEDSEIKYVKEHSYIPKLKTTWADLLNNNSICKNGGWNHFVTKDKYNVVEFKCDVSHLAGIDSKKMKKDLFYNRLVAFPNQSFLKYDKERGMSKHITDFIDYIAEFGEKDYPDMFKKAQDYVSNITFRVIFKDTGRQNYEIFFIGPNYGSVNKDFIDESVLYERFSDEKDYRKPLYARMPEYFAKILYENRADVFTEKHASPNLDNDFVMQNFLFTNGIKKKNLLSYKYGNMALIKLCEKYCPNYNELKERFNSIDSVMANENTISGRSIIRAEFKNREFIRFDVTDDKITYEEED